MTASSPQNDRLEPRQEANDRLRAAEAEVTAALKGPMSNLERALLVADRKDIRAALAKVEGQS
jgi:hypothetical protein